MCMLIFDSNGTASCSIELTGDDNANLRLGQSWSIYTTFGEALSAWLDKLNNHCELKRMTDQQGPRQPQKLNNPRSL